MSQTIQILEDCLINKIAAGEVIENPCSVVKELVENSIDAKANNIHIEIKGSGLQLIKIEDDGIGMNKIDSILCFKRHATSKIQNFDDLTNINSMGFRGEALASIAAVSKIEMKTSQDSIAVCVKIENSKIISVNELARTKGTTIEVKSLFYNVPVRKKFQKSLSYINSGIIKTVINSSLSKPNIGFSLILNGKKIFSLLPNKEEKEIAFKKRTKQLLSNEFSSSSLDLCFEENNIKIFGYIGKPSVCKKTKSMQHLIINDRVITSSIISKFVKEAYATRVSDDDFPIFALHIKIPPYFIDVNVHPQKKEIKLRELIFIKDSIKKAIDNIFINNNKKNGKNPIFFEKNITFSSINIDIDQKTPQEKIFQKFETQLIFDGFNKKENYLKDFIHLNNFVIIDAKILKSFLGLNDNDEIIIIDIGSIYSYFLFEKIINKKNISKSQKLLVPINIDIDSYNLNFIEENLQNFYKLGFDIRITSKNSITIDSMPNILTKENINDLLFLILEDLKHYNKTNIVDKIYEKKIAKQISIFSKKKNYSKKEVINLLNMFIDNKDIKCDFLGNLFFITLNKEKIKTLFKK